MAFNDFLSDRIRVILKEKAVSFHEKNMMGGLTYMVDDKMCIGIVKEDLMARIDPEIYEQALQRNACREMNFTGRPMKGFVFIGPEGTDMDEDLEYWVSLALDYNPRALSSKKKKR